MSIISTVLAGPPPRTTGSDGGGSLGLFGGQQLLPGVGGQEKAALVNTTVYRANSLIAGTNAALPLRIIRRDDVQRAPLRDNAQRHIWGRPNPSVARINLWESEFSACLLGGNAFVWRGSKNRTGPTDELWYLRPSRVRVGLASDGTKVFSLDNDMQKAYTSAEILHIPALSTDGIIGVAPIDVLAAAVNGTNAANTYLQGNYTRNQVPPGILKTDAVLTKDQADEIKANWRESRNGVIRGQEIAVMGHGAEFQAINVAQKDAENILTLEHWELRIAQAYGIPPHMLGIVDKSTSWGTGIEQQVIGFVRFTLLPWLERFEQAIEDELLPAELEMKWDLSGLLRGDTLQRFSAYRLAIASRFMLPNEARAFEDWAPLPGGDVFPELTTTNPSGLTGGGGNGGAQPRTPQASNTFRGVHSADVLPARMLTTSDKDEFTEAIYQKLHADHYVERAEEAASTLLEEGHCPDCDKLIGRRINRGAEIECKRCRKMVAVA